MSDLPAFNAAVALAEAARQNAVAVAHASGLTPAALAAAVSSAHRTFFSRLVASGLANGIPTEPARAALAQNLTPVELITRTDDTPFHVDGGRYLLTITGTFDDDPAGVVELSSAGAGVLASFAEAGSTVVELNYGEFAFSLADVTDFSGTVATTPY